MRELKKISAAFAFFAVVAWVSILNAGTITIDKYGVVPTGGGVEIIAHYSDISSLECCGSGDIAFLQMITLTSVNAAGKTVPVTGILGPTGAFNGQSQFIDPQAGKTLAPGFTTDTYPWYDATFSQYPKAGVTPNGGYGPYIYDRPAGWLKHAKANNNNITFAVTTLVVCITSQPTTDDGTGTITPGTATVLGGFDWGFTVNATPTPTTTIIPITTIGDPSQFNVGTSGTGFQGALDYFAANGGTKWNLITPDNDCCALDVVVPTPSALYSVPVCLIGLVACRRVYKAAA